MFTHLRYSNLPVLRGIPGIPYSRSSPFFSVLGQVARTPRGQLWPSSFRGGHADVTGFGWHPAPKNPEKMDEIGLGKSVDTWWLIPRLVSGLVHPSYKWINPTYPIYNWGYNPFTKWDEPPSTDQYWNILNCWNFRDGYDESAAAWALKLTCWDTLQQHAAAISKGMSRNQHSAKWNLKQCGRIAHDFVPSHNHISGDCMEIHGFHFPLGNDLQMVVFAGHIYLKLLGFTMMYSIYIHICYFWAIQLS